MKTEKLFKEITKYFSKCDRVYMEPVNVGNLEMYLISDGHIIIEAPEILKNQIFYARNGAEFSSANLDKIKMGAIKEMQKGHFTPLKIDLGNVCASIIKFENDLAFINSDFVKLAGDLIGVRGNSSKTPVYIEGQINLFALPINSGSPNNREKIENIIAWEAQRC